MVDEFNFLSTPHLKDLGCSYQDYQFYLMQLLLVYLFLLLPMRLRSWSVMPSKESISNITISEASTVFKVL